MEDEPLLNICRVCMKEGDTFQSIFVPDENTGSTIHLAEMIMSYAAVQITLSDGLPENICPDCAKYVSDFYVFKKKCEESDKNLRVRFGKSPLRLDEDESYISDLIVDSKKSEVFIKAETFEEHRASIKDAADIVGSDDEPEMEPEYPVEPQEVENAVDDSIETEELIGNETIDPFLDLKAEYNSGNANNKFYDDGEVSYLPLKTTLGCSGANKRKYQTLVKDTDIVKPPSDEEPEAETKYPMEPQEVKNSIDDSVEPEELIGNESIDPFLELKAEYDSGTSNNKFYEDGEVSYLPLITTLGSSDMNKRKYTCKLCEKKFIKNSHLTRHMKTHAKVKPHMCATCNKGFARAEQLALHINLHSGIKPHVCKTCTKGFNQLSNLKDHMRTHNGEKPFLCSTCGKGFNQLGNLRQHTVRHSGIKAHLCSICGNGFASKGELGAHLRKHTGARPFVCPVCNHGFTTSSSLTKHKRIHSGEKPYECEVCKMKFSRSGILARHRRTHTGEKPYVCKYCTKAFSQSNDLSSHLRIHTGEKPFICDVCGTAFRQSSAMKTHKKTHLDKTGLLTSKVVISMMHSTFLNTL